MKRGKGRPAYGPLRHRLLAYWAAVEAERDRWSSRSVSRAAKYVSTYMRPVPQLGKLAPGVLRNYHRRIEREATADARFAAILPAALEQHKRLNADAPGRAVIMCRMSFTPDVLDALHLKIVAQ